MSGKHTLIVGCVVFFFILSSTFYCVLSGSGSSRIASVRNIDYSYTIQEINLTNIEKHITFLSNLNSRVSGYPEFYNATRYIAEEMRSYGIDVYLENFTLAVPVVYDAKVTVISPEKISLKAYALWPNLIETCETPEEGLQGRLIYAGYGELNSFNGKDVNGSIVLMEFNSGRKWTNAIMLGAKAVIFIEPETTTTEEATQKFLKIPLDVPRFYVKRSDGELLKNLLENGKVKVKVDLKMRFEEREVSNVIGIIEGTDPTLKNEVVVVSAHYDTISVVPELAPGTDDTTGIATLLELARVFKKYPSRRTIMLVAFSGHHFALQGAREFVDKHFDEIGHKIKLLVNLDLSMEKDALVALWIGYFYQYDLDPGRFIWISQRISNDYMPQLYQLNKNYSGKFINAMDIGSWRRYIPFITLDSEPFTVSGGLGFSFVTAMTSKKYLNTPFDNLKNLNIENVKPQADIALWIIYNLANEDQLPECHATRFNPEGGGFPTLRGRVVTYNFEKGWYDSVPHALVYLEGGPETLIYNHKIVLITDENGEFEFKGCLQSIVRGGGVYVTRYYTMCAYVDDPSPSPVEYATDLGKYGAPMYPGKIIIDKSDNFATIAVFECGSIALFGCLDPFSLEPILPTFEVMEIETYSIPDQWGATSDQGIALIFVPTNVSVQISIKKFGDNQPIALLRNINSDDPSTASGYKVSSRGECLALYNTPLFFTIDGMYQLTTFRLNISTTRGLHSLNVKKIQSKVSESLNAAISALKNKQYDVFYTEAFNAWSLEVQAYREVKSLMQDAINTTIFFFILLIPFSFLFQKLIFDFMEGSKQLIATSMILAIFIAILYFVHPGFHLTSNIYMTLTGLVVIVLLSPALAIIIGETFKYLGELRHRFIGKHFTSISRLGAIVTTFSIGISYMKRRKLRTALTLAGITLITFSLISFTSIMAFSIVKAGEKTGTVFYNGILVRDASWQPLSESLLQYFEMKYENQAVICPRAWLYSSYRPSNVKLNTDSGAEYSAASVLGVVPDEVQLTKLNSTLIEGSWFTDANQRACIISSEAAEVLNVQVNDTVVWNGMNLTVIGIMNDDEVKSIVDLDQEPITPLHPVQPGIERNVHSLPEEVFIIPYSLAKSFGAQIYSIAVKPSNFSRIYQMAEDLANILTGVNIYAGLNKKIFFYIKGVGYEFHGWELIFIPLIIAAFIILNSMLSSVYERTREIAIYSAIGLSPLHIAGLLLAESIVYAIIGSVLGYTMGIVGYPILINLGIFPSDIPLNYSSSWVIITLSVCILVTLLSTLYPMYKASKLATPSIERAWKIPTKPKENEWTIPLPFVAATEREALGILMFLKEFFEAHAVERTDAVFATKDMEYYEENKSKILVMTVRLAPFEMGVVQEVHIKAESSPEGERYHFGIYLKRLDGYLRIWKMSNRKFADEIRKQLLIWRGLSPKDKEEYMARAPELIKQLRTEGEEQNG